MEFQSRQLLDRGYEEVTAPEPVPVPVPVPLPVPLPLPLPLPLPRVDTPGRGFRVRCLVDNHVTQRQNALRCRSPVLLMVPSGHRSPFFEGLAAAR